MLAAAKWWEVVSAFGVAVGALAAAVGAIAAWRAASASRATSRDALEALAVGICPALKVRFTTVVSNAGVHRTAIVQNESEWAAADLVFELRFRDGTSISERTERLAPPKARRQPPDDGQWSVVLAPAGEPGSPTVEELAEIAVLRYSDDRRIRRYEQFFTFNFTRTRDADGIETTGSSINIDKRRI